MHCWLPSLLCWCSSCWSCCCSCCLEDLVEESSNHIQNCVWWPESVLALLKGFLQLQLLFLSIDLAPAATAWGVEMVRSLEILRFLYPQVCSIPCPSINDFSTVWKQFNRGKIGFSKNGAYTRLKINFDLHLKTYIKFTSKWITDLNMKYEIIKLLVKIGENLKDLRLGRVLTPKAWTIKEKK